MRDPDTELRVDAIPSLRRPVLVASFRGWNDGGHGASMAGTFLAKAWNAEFKPAWEKAGGKIVSDNPMSYNRSTDFYSGVGKVMAEKPDVLFVGGASEPIGLKIISFRLCSALRHQFGLGLNTVWTPG